MKPSTPDLDAYAVVTEKCLDTVALYWYYKPISVGFDWRTIVWSTSPNTMAVDGLDMAAAVAAVAASIYADNFDAPAVVTSV